MMDAQDIDAAPVLDTRQELEATVVPGEWDAAAGEK
jgi:hypothetical protein